jgi:hypothetical protein
MWKNTLNSPEELDGSSQLAGSQAAIVVLEHTYPCRRAGTDSNVGSSSYAQADRAVVDQDLELDELGAYFVKLSHCMKQARPETASQELLSCARASC